MMMPCLDFLKIADTHYLSLHKFLGWHAKIFFTTDQFYEVAGNLIRV